MKKLSISDKLYLLDLLNSGCTDSDIEDVCKSRNISMREAFHFIAVENAPDCCKKCKHVDFFPSMYPCTSCSRPKKDYYEES